VNRRRYHSGDDSAYERQDESDGDWSSADDRHRRDSRSGGDGPVARQIGKIQDSIADEYADDHQRKNQSVYKYSFYHLIPLHRKTAGKPAV